jgi:NAD(P)-dependent dehydrogenase (short-subunit alcohol dehydrogenase family)
VTICHNYYPIMSHNGKVYVVTGANSGIGLAAAKLLIEEGAKVYITGRNAQAVADAAKQLGPNAIGIRADAATVADSVAMAKFIEQQGDKLDG